MISPIDEAAAKAITLYVLRVLRNREPHDHVIEAGISETWEPSSDRPYIGHYQMIRAFHAMLDAEIRALEAGDG